MSEAVNAVVADESSADQSATNDNAAASAAAQATDKVETTTTDAAQQPVVADKAADKTVEDVVKEVKKESPWPDDWREQLAGKDEAFLRQLKRYSSPSTFANGWKEREDVIRSGKLRVERPSDPSDEKAMAAWRKAAGIPDTPEGYKLSDDVVKRLTDADKPVLSSYTEMAHKEGLPPEAVDKTTRWFFDQQQAAFEQQTVEDAKQADDCDTELSKQWPRNEFKGNLNLAKRYVEDHLGIPYKEYAGLRMSDGRLLGNVPEHLMKLADAGRNTFGDAVFASSDVATKHATRKAEIEKIRATDFDLYQREYSTEYREILEKELKRKK